MSSRLNIAVVSKDNCEMHSIINTNVIIDLIKTKSKYLKITCIDSFGIGYIKIIGMYL